MNYDPIMQEANKNLPFDEFVFKEPRCQLEPRFDRAGRFVGGCDYVSTAEAAATGKHGCYEYAYDDEEDVELRQKPMSVEVMAQAAFRISEHAAVHELEHVRIIGHGGEWLIRSAANLATFSSTVHGTIATLSPDTRDHFFVQSNGLPLAEDSDEAAAKLAILQEYDYEVGLSLDGDRQATDRHRRDARGESIYDRVVVAAQKLRENGLRWGILGVIDTHNDPVETVESLASLEPGSISFLLPHANHSVPKEPGPMSYAEWQKAVFDWYYAQPEGSRIAMPIFDTYLDVLLGGQSTHESVANRPLQELFILPNGYYQHIDHLKSTEKGAVATGMDVFRHSIDYLARHDSGIIARRLGKAGLSQTCLECPLLKPCGGGLYSHRFKAGQRPLKITDPPEVYAQRFQNPTIYCDDQMQLLPHIARRVEDDLEAPSGSLVKGLADS